MNETKQAPAPNELRLLWSEVGENNQANKYMSCVGKRSEEKESQVRRKATTDVCRSLSDMMSCNQSPGCSAVKGRGNSRSMPAEHRGRCSPTQSPVGLVGGSEPGSMSSAL